MKLVRAFVREEKVEDVVGALETHGVCGFTLSRASGRGRQVVTTVWRGQKCRTFRPMATVEVIADDSVAEDIARMIADSAHTGHAGDGLVYILGLDSAYSVRTRWTATA